ncbi:MAG: DUF5107 domain-containing protein [Clostridia bacterium]|nr:DUF5107 domain-containing protein [Clostridia bacterium]
MLKLEKITIPAADMGELNSLPPVSVKINLADLRDDEGLNEKDGLFINYGNVATSYPYRYQDMYDRSLTATEYTAAVLENEKLRAVFIPQLGGKLWSLTDKSTDRGLLFTNTVVRPCNLAVRNAWTSGGIEWNCGFRGHHPYTCETVNTARTVLDDGTEVLRFYWYERIRRTVVQMDFWIPDGADCLFSRVRLVNTSDETVPMYWWSNIAVVQREGDRVIVPAQQAYTTLNNSVVKIDVTEDMTYPLRGKRAKDYFWTTDHDRRRYVAQVGRDGCGLVQTSSSLLKGRKLFIWGNFRGGKKWMNFLTADNCGGDYDEIQCGLAHSQYECLPMEGHAVWEWCEVYGPVKGDPEKLHGAWSEAQKEIEDRLNERITEEALEKLLTDTSAMAERPAELLIPMDDGWAALENIRDCRHLDFGPLQREQEDWVRLRETGTAGLHDPEDVPLSYCLGSEWENLLKNDADNWYSCYMLGTAMLASEHYEEAVKWLERSRGLQENVWSVYSLAIAARQTGDHEKEISLMMKAYEMRPFDLCLARETLRTFYDNGLSAETIAMFDGKRSAGYSPETDPMLGDPRCLLYYAYALAAEGRNEDAAKIVCGEDGKHFLIVPDIREGELMTVKLWKLMSGSDLPYDLDFRLSGE